MDRFDMMLAKLMDIIVNAGQSIKQPGQSILIVYPESPTSQALDSRSHFSRFQPFWASRKLSGILGPLPVEVNHRKSHKCETYVGVGDPTNFSKISAKENFGGSMLSKET